MKNAQEGIDQETPKKDSNVVPGANSTLTPDIPAIHAAFEGVSNSKNAFEMGQEMNARAAEAMQKEEEDKLRAEEEKIMRAKKAEEGRVKAKQKAEEEKKRAEQKEEEDKVRSEIKVLEAEKRRVKR